jgi:hypothetical protein
MFDPRGKKRGNSVMSVPCYRHPDRPAGHFCQKDGNYMCGECACCHSPGTYCQYRTACVIHVLTKEGMLSPCGEKEPADRLEQNSDFSDRPSRPGPPRETGESSMGNPGTRSNR